MPTTIKIRDFIENAMNGPIDMNSDTFAIALSNTAPGTETNNPTNDGNGVLANVTQISYTNYEDNMTVDRRLQSVTSAANGGTYTFDAADVQITAGAGGPIATFQYIYIFDDTQAGDPLVLCIDNQAPVALSSGQSVTLSFSSSPLGILTIV